ncbi:hypothetical protein QFZ42_003342 [Variovorax paradoxus]|nr:hypothetical protein [Variovorax paradoxus]
MGIVIPLKAPNHGASVQKAVDEIGQRARYSGTRGLIWIMEHEDGTQTTGVCGSFDSDLDKAADAIKAGFSCLLGHSACTDTDSKLPRRLRKEYKDEEEHHCGAVACNMRR